ncbi:MAG: hypothetical protein NC402_02960 [Prevotella sp.]|nr:hypothetical protein [Prevotella sp.]MCM1074773.1 hypothetical protein [Ruminococcus sp.]
MKKLPNTCLLIALLLLLLPLPGFCDEHNVPSTARVYPNMDMAAARAYCDSTALRSPEGIYYWPDRNVVVLVRASHKMHGLATEFEAVAVESSDILLEPGAVLAYFYPTASPKEYHAYIYENVSSESISSPKHKSAKFSDENQTMLMEGKKLKFTFNPLALIPRMRSVFRLRQDNPVSELPNGLTRIYPPNTATAKSLLFPRYL